MADHRELEEFVSGAFTSSPYTLDLAISAFLQALHSRRRPSVCSPFPISLFSKHDGKDFAAAEAALQKLSSIQFKSQASLTEPPDLATHKESLFAALPLESLQLLHWLLRFRYDVQLVVDPAVELPNDIFSKIFTSSESKLEYRPDYILKLQESNKRGSSAFEENKCKHGSIFAFHGTPAENLHGILRCGLLILSNSTLQRNGAIFGEGIYLSSNLSVAFGFSKSGLGWEQSHLGHKARYVLLCEVAKGDQVLCSDAASASQASPSGPAKDLGTYVIVQNSDLVKLRYILVYAESVGDEVTGGSAKDKSWADSYVVSPVKIRNWCTFFILLYVALFLGMALLNSLITSKTAARFYRR